MVNMLSITRYFLVSLKPGLIKTAKLLALFCAVSFLTALIVLFVGYKTNTSVWTYNNPYYINCHSDQTLWSIGTAPDDNRSIIIDHVYPTPQYWIGDTSYGGKDDGIAIDMSVIPLIFVLSCFTFSVIFIVRRIVHGDVLH